MYDADYLSYRLVLLTWITYFKQIIWLSEPNIQPGYSLRTFTGHSASVMSLDFHPNKEDLICSCDGDGEIRYWSINNGSCARVFKVWYSVKLINFFLHSKKKKKLWSSFTNISHFIAIFWLFLLKIQLCSKFVFLQGGTNQMRFQPRQGRYLAAAADNNISILDVETQVCRQTLKVSCGPSD